MHQDFLVNESSLIIVSLDVPGVEARWFKELKKVSVLVAKLKKSATDTCIVETSHALFNYFFWVLSYTFLNNESFCYNQGGEGRKK